MSRMTKRQKRRNKFNIRSRPKITTQHELNHLLNRILDVPSQENYFDLLHESFNSRGTRFVTPLADVWTGFIEDLTWADRFTDLSTVCPPWKISGVPEPDETKRNQPCGWYVTFNRNLYGPFKSREEAAAYTKLQYENTFISRKIKLRITSEPDYMKLCTQRYTSFNAWQNMLHETRQKYGRNYDPLCLIQHYRQHLAKKHIRSKKIYQHLKDENLLEIDMVSVLSECGLEVDAARMKMVLEQYMQQ